MALSKQAKIAREKARAKAARLRYEEEKKRIIAARKGVRTREKPENLFQAIINSLSKYKTTSQKRDYSVFRAQKRKLYRAAPLMAETWIADAADSAGWDLVSSARFAKMS